MEENAQEDQTNYYDRNYEAHLNSNQQYKYKIKNPLAAINWRRIGQAIDQIKGNAIDRQFGVLGGFLSQFTGFFSAVGGIASSSVNIHFFIFMTFQLLINESEIIETMLYLCKCSF